VKPQINQKKRVVASDLPSLSLVASVICAYWNLCRRAMVHSAAAAGTRKLAGVVPEQSLERCDGLESGFAAVVARVDDAAVARVLRAPYPACFALPEFRARRRAYTGVALALPPGLPCGRWLGDNPLLAANGTQLDDGRDPAMKRRM
jgi:hypothetical protein